MLLCLCNCAVHCYLNLYVVVLSVKCDLFKYGTSCNTLYVPDDLHDLTKALYSTMHYGGIYGIIRVTKAVGTIYHHRKQIPMV